MSDLILEPRGGTSSVIRTEGTQIGAQGRVGHLPCETGGPTARRVLAEGGAAARPVGVEPPPVRRGGEGRVGVVVGKGRGGVSGTGLDWQEGDGFPLAADPRCLFASVVTDNRQPHGNSRATAASCSLEEQQM
ncbi:unnamed protein product [Boreogadus saida]